MSVEILPRKLFSLPLSDPSSICACGIEGGSHEETFGNRHNSICSAGEPVRAGSHCLVTTVRYYNPTFGRKLGSSSAGWLSARRWKFRGTQGTLFLRSFRPVPVEGKAEHLGLCTNQRHAT